VFGWGSLEKTHNTLLKKANQGNREVEKTKGPRNGECSSLKRQLAAETGKSWGRFEKRTTRGGGVAVRHQPWGEKTVSRRKKKLSGPSKNRRREPKQNNCFVPDGFRKRKEEARLGKRSSFGGRLEPGGRRRTRDLQARSRNSEERGGSQLFRKKAGH